MATRKNVGIYDDANFQVTKIINEEVLNNSLIDHDPNTKLVTLIQFDCYRFGQKIGTVQIPVFPDEIETYKIGDRWKLTKV